MQLLREPLVCCWARFRIMRGISNLDHEGTLSTQVKQFKHNNHGNGITFADPDVHQLSNVKPDGYKYYDYILVHVDKCIDSIGLPQ